MTPVYFSKLDIIHSLERKFPITGTVHLQLCNAIVIQNCSSTVQQQKQPMMSRDLFALIGWKTLNWVTTGNEF
jgi:hypothetical protein